MNEDQIRLLIREELTDFLQMCEDQVLMDDDHAGRIAKLNTVLAIKNNLQIRINILKERIEISEKGDPWNE